MAAENISSHRKKKRKKKKKTYTKNHNVSNILQNEFNNH